MSVLIIFPVILQTVINLIMLSIGGQGDSLQSCIEQKTAHKVCVNDKYSAIFVCYI